MRALVVATILMACRSSESPPVQELIPIVPVDAVPLLIPPSMKDMVVIPEGDSRRCWYTENGKCTQIEAIHSKQFAIDKYEVTVASYQACIDEGACTAPQLCEPAARTWPHAKKHPMNCVDASQAKEFCRAVGKRLAYRHEWLRATAIDGWYDAELTARGFRCGEVAASIDEACRQIGTSEVGAHPRDISDWGLLDVRGNVSEFVYDGYDPFLARYFNRYADDPIVALPEGGAFMSGRRYRAEPYAGPGVGFRCATSVLPTGAAP